jgi:hypothetical protein
MTPGSCITTADCANPDVPLLRCYPEVGQCLCASDYALDGPQCADASPATLGTRVAMGLSVGVIVLLVLTYAPTLYVVIRFRLWRRDAAGVSYVLSWLSIASVLVAASLHLCQTFSADPALASAGRAFFLLSVSLVASTTFLMSATFVDVTQLKKQYTARLTGVLLIALGPFLVVVVLGAVLWLTDREEDWEWTLAVVVIYLVLTVVSIAGPVFLYVRMARNMSRTANRRTPRLSLLCEAMAAEIVYGNRAMRRVLGIYEGSDDSDDLVMFGDSKHDSKGLARADSKRSMRASKDFNGESLDVILNAAKGGAGSVHDVFPAGNSSKLRKFFLGDNNASHTAKTRRKETRFVRFLGRAVRMSFFLALSLLGFAASMLAYHFCAQRVDASLDVRRVALAMAFAQTFLALGVAQLLCVCSAAWTTLTHAVALATDAQIHAHLHADGFSGESARVSKDARDATND